MNFYNFSFFLAKIFDNLVYHKHTYAISFWFVSSFVPLVDRFYLRELLVKSSTSVLSFFFAGSFVGAWSSFNETWGIEKNKIKIFNLLKREQFPMKGSLGFSESLSIGKFVKSKVFPRISPFEAFEEKNSGNHNMIICTICFHEFSGFFFY